MNRIASHVSTSVEKTAESAIAPSQGGRSRVSTVGSTAFGSVIPGTATRPIMPSSTGTNAKSTSTAALSATPTRTARSVAPPHDFWINPGEMMNAGPVSASSVQPDPGPAEYMKLPNQGGADGPVTAWRPPAAFSAAGSATANPAIITISCSVLTHADPSSPPAVK